MYIFTPLVITLPLFSMNRNGSNHVANQVVKKWPFLETRTGHVSTGHVSTALLYTFFYVLFCLTAVALLQGYLVEALKERMAYLQKPDGQKRGKAQMHVTPSSPVQPLMPSSPVVTVQLSEDGASHERHLKCLKRESESVRTFAPTSRYIATSTSHANLFRLIVTLGFFYLLYPQVTKELMKRTFPLRRQDVLDGTFTMEVLFSTYPPLKYPEEVCCYMYM